MGTQQRTEIEIAGIVDQHGVARPQQEAADQVDRLRPGGGEQQLLRWDLEPFVGEPRHQHAAQGQRAARCAVIGEHRVVGPRQAAERAPQRIGRHPVGRQPAAARLHRAAAGIERLPRHPERIDGAVALRLVLGERERRQRGGRRRRSPEPGRARIRPSAASRS